MVESEHSASIDDPVGNACWFPIDLLNSGALEFALTDRETIERLAGLADAVWDPSGLPKQIVPLQKLTLLCDSPKPRLNFIWHTAYCCSTLLSRLLDFQDRNLSIREPKILVALANAKRLGWLGRREMEPLADVVFRQHARPIPPGTQVTVKPSSAANYLIRDASALCTGKMLVLHSDLPTFLISIAQDGEYRRGYNRRLFTLVAGDGHDQARWSREKLFELSDLQIAALVWHMHIAEFTRSLPMIEPGRIATLDCDALLMSPRQTLAKVDNFLMLGIGPDRIRAKLEGPISGRHAKQTDQPYDAARRRDTLKISGRLREDIEAVVKWSYEVCRSTPKGPPLPLPLIELEKDYLRISD